MLASKPQTHMPGLRYIIIVFSLTDGTPLERVGLL
jgi:hypothetical protein